MRFVASAPDAGGTDVPYLRIFTNSDTHDAIFSPNTQLPDADVAEGPFHEWVATSGSWRYDDDPGNDPDIPFADLITAHGTDVDQRDLHHDRLRRRINEPGLAVAVG